MFKIKKYWFSMVFIGFIATGCASTNSIQIANLEKSDKSSYEFLKRTYSWVTIDTSSENYQKWKKEFIDANPKAPISQVNQCLGMKDSIKGTIYGTGQIGLNTYKNCLPGKTGPKNIITTFEANNIFGWITVIQSDSKRWSQGIYEDYIVYKLGVIEYDNKAELFSDGWYRWGYSAEKNGVYAQEAFSKGVYEQDKRNVGVILNTLDKYNVKYTAIK